MVGDETPITEASSLWVSLCMSIYLFRFFAKTSLDHIVIVLSPFSVCDVYVFLPIFYTIDSKKQVFRLIFCRKLAKN
jgi:hypothetical protein